MCYPDEALFQCEFMEPNLTMNLVMCKIQHYTLAAPDQMGCFHKVINDPRHGKTRILHLRTQRCGLAAFSLQI